MAFSSDRMYGRLRVAAEREQAAREKLDASTYQLARYEAGKVTNLKNGYLWDRGLESKLMALRLQVPCDQGDLRMAQLEAKEAESDGENIRVAEEGFKGPRAACQEPKMRI
jgi:hypothetical protein